MIDGITIKKKYCDGHQYITVRMPETLVAQLDQISTQTNRSRNALINTLLLKALQIVRIDEE